MNGRILEILLYYMFVYFVFVCLQRSFALVCFGARATNAKFSNKLL